MAYGDNYYSGDAAVLECTGWADPRNTSKTIRKLQKIKFTYQEERNTVADIIDELNGDLDDCVYTHDTRFPLKSKIPVMCDEIQEAIKTVILAGSYRPPDVSDTNKDLTVKSTSFSQSKSGNSKNKGKDDDDSDKGNKDDTSIT